MHQTLPQKQPQPASAQLGFPEVRRNDPSTDEAALLLPSLRRQWYHV